MSTPKAAIGKNWVNVSDELGFIDGQRYFIQNTMPSGLWFVESATEPEANDTGIILNEGVPVPLVKEAGINFYVRTQVAPVGRVASMKMA